MGLLEKIPSKFPFISLTKNEKTPKNRGFFDVVLNLIQLHTLSLVIVKKLNILHTPISEFAYPRGVLHTPISK